MPKSKASVKFKSTFPSLSSKKVKCAYQANPTPADQYQRAFLTSTIFYYINTNKSATLFRGQSGVVEIAATNNLYTFYPDVKGYPPVAVSRGELFLEHEPIGHES